MKKLNLNDLTEDKELRIIPYIRENFRRIQEGVDNGTLGGGGGSPGPQGPTGPAGSAGADGVSYEEEFETVSKNLKSWDYVLNYTMGTLTSVVYTLGPDSVTKTLNYTGPLLTSIVLSGDTPSGIELTKTLSYTGSDLTSVAYT